MSVDNQAPKRLSNRLIAFGLALVALVAYALITLKFQYGAL
jgi:hypothetical protein